MEFCFQLERGIISNSVELGQDDSERTPLLPDSERSQDTDNEARPKKAARWVARNAVIIFMSLLILAVIIVLSVFFRGMIWPCFDIKCGDSADFSQCIARKTHTASRRFASLLRVFMHPPKSSTTFRQTTRILTRATTLKSWFVEDGMNIMILGRIKEMPSLVPS